MREKLVDPTQFERKRRLKKAGDARRPPLASVALLEFMGPGHSSDELRLPPPPGGFNGDSDVTPFPDREFTRNVVERGEQKSKHVLERAFAKAQVPPDRLDRMKALLSREAQMLGLLNLVQSETDAIIEHMKAEYKANGQY